MSFSGDWCLPMTRSLKLKDIFKVNITIFSCKKTLNRQVYFKDICIVNNIVICLLTFKENEEKTLIQKSQEILTFGKRALGC
jgi:hypothetical protein